MLGKYLIIGVKPNSIEYLLYKNNCVYSSFIGDRLIFIVEKNFFQNINGSRDLVLSEFDEDFKLKLLKNEIDKKLIFNEFVNKNYLHSGVLLSGGTYHKYTAIKGGKDWFTSSITTDSNVGLKHLELSPSKLFCNNNFGKLEYYNNLTKITGFKPKYFIQPIRLEEAYQVFKTFLYTENIIVVNYTDKNKREFYYESGSINFNLLGYDVVTLKQLIDCQKNYYDNFNYLNSNVDDIDELMLQSILDDFANECNNTITMRAILKHQSNYEAKILASKKLTLNEELAKNLTNLDISLFFKSI